MYSTRLRNDTQRYVAKCIINQSGPKVIDFVVDTGARYTCCSSLNISTRLDEQDFHNTETKTLGGIVAGYAIKVYKYHVEQFTIGTIDMGAQDIWITFDQRTTDDVLGMDILKQVYFLQDMIANRLIFSKEKSKLTCNI